MCASLVPGLSSFEIIPLCCWLRHRSYADKDAGHEHARRVYYEAILGIKKGIPVQS